MGPPSVDNTLSLYLQRKLALVCTRSGCGKSAAPDSDECAPHAADTRARKRKNAKRRRARLREGKRCIDCKRRSSTIRCQRCEKQNRRYSVSAAPISVDKRDLWRSEVGTHAWGSGKYETQRYIGKGRRGRLTREEQAEEDARLLSMAVEKIIQTRDRNLPLVVSDEILVLPRIQREAARRTAMEPLGFAVRALVEVARRHGYVIELHDPDSE